jgi:hypothetical protein
MVSLKSKINIFFIILVLVLGSIGYFYYQKNSYSKDIVRLEISGPKEAVLAEEIEYRVSYKNNGDVRLEDPELIFEYPSNSLPLLREVKTAEDFGGAIYPGEEKSFSFKARIFGKEAEIMEAKAVLRYRPKNLKAFYESATTFTTKIEKVPLTFEFDIPSKIESGKNIQFRMNYFSNLDYPLSDLRANIRYPEGFEFVKASPEGIARDEWDLPLLNKANGGRIEIEGKVMGQVGEEKIFTANLGLWRDGEFVVLKETSKGVEITEPSLHISQTINGSSEYKASPGEFLHYEIFFKNIGEEDLSDLFLVSRLEGPFDFSTLKADRGDFEKGDNSVIFDWRLNSDLQLLKSQKEGKVEFWIDLKEDWGTEKGSPKIINKVYLAQTRKEFENKINTRLEAVQKGYFEDEVFGNSGEIPPKSGAATSYTIIWQVKNYYNPVENAKVKAILPKNSSLTGKIFPEEEFSKFTFDSESREIVWNIGGMEAGKGVLNSALNIAFQINFLPDDSQKGKTPEIIGELRIEGEDQWTEQLLEATTSAVTTALPDDETIDGNEGIVR